LAVFEGNLRPSFHLHRDSDVTIAAADVIIGETLIAKGLSR
jgi:hypothetical protein